MKYRIIPYRMGSKSARLLATTLSMEVGYRVYLGPPKNHRFNIFWGTTVPHNFVPGEDLNDPEAVKIARDKLLTFVALQGVSPIPPYSTDKEEAEGWQADGKIVLARTTTGYGGSGIVVCHPSDPIPDAPLYVLYIKKRKEFRVHVFGNKAVAVYEKRRRVGKQADTLIRSHSRGWVFCKMNVWEPEDLRGIAVNAVQALNLNFGAVDAIWNEHSNRVYVLEVNTAPGLCPQSAGIYCANILARQVQSDGVGADHPNL